jgi:hypothetical protein
MGDRAGLTGGHLQIDLTNIKMSATEQQDLLRAVRATCVDLIDVEMPAIGLSADRGLNIDLTKVEMSGDDQQTLLRALQTTVVAQLARQSAMSKVVTISLSPNNGTKPKPEPSPKPGEPAPTPPPKP